MSEISNDSPEQFGEFDSIAGKATRKMKVGERVAFTTQFGDQEPPLMGTIVETEFEYEPRIRRHAVKLDNGNGTWRCGSEKHPYAFFFESDLSSIERNEVQ